MSKPASGVLATISIEIMENGDVSQTTKNATPKMVAYALTSLILRLATEFREQNPGMAGTEVFLRVAAAAAICANVAANEEQETLAAAHRVQPATAGDLKQMSATIDSRLPA